MIEAAFQTRPRAVRVEQSALVPPILSYRPERRAWVLEEEYAYPDGEVTLKVPPGFEFDLASVPRFAWPLIAPFELSIVAPLLHDFLYRHGGRPPAGTVIPPRSYTRKEADRLFRAAMKLERVAAWRIFLAYRAVRWFGRSSWRG